MAYVLHRLPAVADIILTPEYEHFAEAVMTSHNKANQQAALDISPAMGDILTDMQSCLQQLVIEPCMHVKILAKLVSRLACLLENVNKLPLLFHTYQSFGSCWRSHVPFQS